MGTPDTFREPCPDRILDRVGSSFVIGGVGGSAFHLIKGMYNSPKGSRFLRGMQAVIMNAPRIGGYCAAWGGLISTFDCTLVYLRQKEDPWNYIISGVATNGIFYMRKGLGPASRAAVFGGCFLALLEGVDIMLEKTMAPRQEKSIPRRPRMPGMSRTQKRQMQNQNQNTASSSPSLS